MTPLTKGYGLVSTTNLFVVAVVVSIPILGVIIWWWQRWWQEHDVSPMARFIKNSSIPIVANLFGRVLDLGFAAVTLRALGPTASGAWSFVALITSMYLVTIINWGLNDLAVREAAANPHQAGRLFGIGLAMRWVMAAVVTPLTLIGLWLLQDVMPPLSSGTFVALILLLLHLWPAGTAAAASASFQAAQRMEIPALVVVFTSLIRTGIGIILVWTLTDNESRIIAMGAVALGATILNAALLWWLQRKYLFVAGLVWDWPFMRRLWREAFPLLLNSLLLTVFFRFDAILLRSMAGDTVLGLYDAAYKVISLTQIIPPYVVGALFPLLAQRAVHQPDTLAPLVTRAILVLQWVAWMGVATVTIMANDLIWLLGGPQYLPEAANLLRVLIWYLPLSYATGVVQYALIATKQQRAITWAFAVGTLINLTGNTLFIPLYGGFAAAVMTIITEIALMSALWPTLKRIQLIIPIVPLLQSGAVTVGITALGWWLSSLGVPSLLVAIVCVSAIAISAHQLGTLDRAVYTMLSQIKGRIQ